jgi:hypothetical protein
MLRNAGSLKLASALRPSPSSSVSGPYPTYTSRSDPDDHTLNVYVRMAEAQATQGACLEYYVRDHRSMRGYWDSPSGLTQAHRRRFERTARIRVGQEPRSKTSARPRDLMEFRRVVRDEVRIFRDWPRPRAALALDFFFRTTRRQPPALWALPKHYLDLCGATSAPEADPGPVLFGDDRQVKMLFASCVHAWQPDGTGPAPSIEIVARSRSDFLAGMDLTDRLFVW